MVRAEIQSLFLATQDAPGDYEGRAKAEAGPTKTVVANGTGAGAADLLFHDERSIAGSGNEDLDLQALTDSFGQAFNAAEVAVLRVEAASTNAGAIELTPGASNGWTAILSGTAPKISIPPGCSMQFEALPDGSLAVSGSNKVLNVANAGGTTAAYTISILGRSA